MASGSRTKSSPPLLDARAKFKVNSSTEKISWSAVHESNLQTKKNLKVVRRWKVENKLIFSNLGVSRWLLLVVYSQSTIRHNNSSFYWILHRIWEGSFCSDTLHTLTLRHAPLIEEVALTISIHLFWKDIYRDRYSKGTHLTVSLSLYLVQCILRNTCTILNAGLGPHCIIALGS